MLLEAHIELIKEGVYHQVIIVGNGKNCYKLNEKIKKEEVTDTFLLIGERRNPYPYADAADFYIQPSRTDSYPLVVGEALVLDKPFIAKDCGGFVK